MCGWWLFCLPRCTERFNFTCYTIFKWRTSRSKETPKEVDRFRVTKESQVGADPKLVSLLKALYWKRLCSPLQLRRRSDQEADHAKAETDEIGINVVPGVHVEAVTKKPVVSESAKRRLERGVRSVKCFGALLNLFVQPKRKLLK